MSKQTLALLSFGLLALAAFCFRLLGDLDVLTQIVIGEWRLGGFLDFKRELCLSYQVPCISQSGFGVGWLSQLFFAAVDVLGGLHAVRVLSGIVFVTAFLLLVRLGMRVGEGQPQGVSLFCPILAGTLGFLVSYTSAASRPQNIALLGFAVIHWILFSKGFCWRKFLGAVIVGLLWQNSHPSVGLGALLAALMALSQLPEWIRSRDKSFVFPLIICFTLTVIHFATPLGIEILAVSRANVEISRHVLGVSEWMPPWHESVRSAVMVYWAALLLSLFLLIRLRFKVSLQSILFFAVFTALSLWAARFVLFWALVMVPIWSVWFERLRPKELFCWPASGSVGKEKSALIVLGLFSVLVLSVLFTYPKPMHADVTKCVQALSLEPGLSRIYNYREWAGPILYSSPSRQVAIDGRLYLYDKTAWDEYHGAALGEIPLEELLENHGMDAFLLRKSFHPKLIEALDESGRWARFCEDDLGIAFVKHTARP